MGQNPNAYTDFHLFCELNQGKKEEVLVSYSKPRKQGKNMCLKMIGEELQDQLLSLRLLIIMATSKTIPL